MSKKYLAMTPVENANITSLYTSDIYFDEWTPCITAPWSRLYNEKTHSLQPEWDHLNSKDSTYFLFKVPEKAIHGLLFIDNGKCYFKDHHKGRLSKLRIRNSLKGMNILGAFWVPHQQLLIVHDIYMHESSSVCEEVFSSRWQLLAKATTFIENDPSLQGFTLTIVTSLTNEDAGSGKHPGTTNATAGVSKNQRPVNEETTGCIILQPNVGLAKVIYGIPLEVVAGKTKRGTAAVANENHSKDSQKKDETDVDEAFITKHSKFNGPESFQLWSGTKDLGMPCIQSLKLIQEVRNKLKTIDKFAVNIKWNKNLDSYEVLSIK